MVISVLAACQTEGPGWKGGTGVGNPGSTQLVTARATDASLDAGAGYVTSLALTACDDGEVETVEVDAPVDLLGSGALAVPGGTWCEVSVAFDQGVTYSGATTDGGTFSLALELATIDLPLLSPLVVDETALLTELGFTGWLSAEELGAPGAGDHVDVGPSDPLHDTLVRRLGAASAMFLDDDEDGELDDDERDDHELGEGEDRDEEEGDDDDDDDDS